MSRKSIGIENYQAYQHRFVKKTDVVQFKNPTSLPKCELQQL